MYSLPLIVTTRSFGINTTVPEFVFTYVSIDTSRASKERTHATPKSTANVCERFFSLSIENASQQWLTNQSFHDITHCFISKLENKRSMPCGQDDILLQHGIQVDKFSVSRFSEHKLQSVCLTHAHSDHMADLVANYGKRGIKVYATRITATLAMIAVKGLSPETFEVVDLYEPFHPAKDVTAWAFPSFHCDGSCMFLFECFASTEPFRILYTGDFRWNKEIRENSLLMDHKIHRLYYDDMFDEITDTYPSFAESYETLRRHFTDLRDGPATKRVFIHASVLGVEPMLRELADQFDITFSLSDSLANTWRGRQLEFLLQHRITCTARSPYILGITRLDDVDDPAQPWIIPTCTYFLCDKTDKTKKKTEKPHHYYVQFCTHSNNQENTHLKILISATEVNPCNEAIKSLTCRERKDP